LLSSNNTFSFYKTFDYKILEKVVLVVMAKLIFRKQGTKRSKSTIYTSSYPDGKHEAGGQKPSYSCVY